MKSLQSLAVIGIGLLLAACLIGIFWTSTSETPRPATTKAPAVDQSLLAEARQLAILADTPDEQELARQSVHLTDQEVDEAFTIELRKAAAAKPPASGPLHDLAETIDHLNRTVADHQNRIAELTKQAANSESAAEDLDLAKAQLSLDQDELDDARQDLARQGGDPHAELERELHDHETAQQQGLQFAKAAVVVGGTLHDQFSAWRALASKQQQIDSAASATARRAAALLAQHDSLEKKIASGAPPDDVDTQTTIARLRNLSDQRKNLIDFDRRVQNLRQAAQVFQTWSHVQDGRQRAALHAVLRSLGLILAILLVMALADRAVMRAFHQADRKRLHQLRLITTVAVNLSAVILILLIVFGPPTQVTTFLGLATAGLTVVMKDFIVSFFGWFALMGKNGVRIGDWVEIEGISGEVIEVGLLKTVLLEIGNWNDSGHPTGRQVRFSNSYALEQHYFNFSTAGQWLWDELAVTLPPGGDPYGVAEQIRATVEQATEQDTVAAEEEWKRVTHEYGAHPFSAKPAVSLRPGSTGLEVAVRYITRAHERFAVKSRLFQSIVPLLHQGA